MAFLTISGYEIPISATGVSLQRLGLGETAISYKGAQMADRWGVTDQFELTATLMDRAQATALTGLIQGDGHCIPFDRHFYSTKGLPPLSGYLATFSVTGGAVGGGYIQVTSGSNIKYQFESPSDRTMMVLKYVGAAWVHYALTYDASTGTTTQYKNGAPHTPIAGDSIVNWFSYTPSAASATWQLDGKDIAGVAANSRYDQLVIAPYLMPADMIAAFDTELLTTGLPFSALPLLSVRGDMITDGPKNYVGSTTASTYQIARVAAADNIALDLTFTLTEYQARLT